MAHHWDRGVLAQSSWHKLEAIGTMPDAAAMIAAGEKSGAWPVALREEGIRTADSSLVVPDAKAIVGMYAEHPDRPLGVVSEGYRACTVDEWRRLIAAACDAGAQPTGAFSLRGGSRPLATFEVGKSNGLRTHLTIVDSFNATKSLTCGMTSVRVVCANTLAASMRADGKGMAKLRHTASLEEKINVLVESIPLAIASGDKMRETFERAERTLVTRDSFSALFDKLFPEAEEGASKLANTLANNERRDAMVAASLPINNCGSTVATIWNAATYLVDRNANGTARKTRAEDPLDSMLFGSRAKRVEEIQTIIEVVLRDGTTQLATATQAVEMGVDSKLVGRKVLEEMLDAE